MKQARVEVYERRGEGPAKRVGQFDVSAGSLDELRRKARVKAENFVGKKVCLSFSPSDSEKYRIVATVAKQA